VRDVKPLPRTAGCATEFAVDLLRGKWKAVILARLKDGPLRYAELRRDVPGIADKVLTERLTDLTGLGFVEPVPGDHGAYRLTKRGRAARPMLEALYAWGAEEARDRGVVIRDS
jgi:DNA-binding HxlR family transcriptional regulator